MISSFAEGFIFGVSATLGFVTVYILAVWYAFYCHKDLIKTTQKIYKKILGWVNHLKKRQEK